MTFGYRDRRFPVRAREAGFRVDLGATVARAYRAGRGRTLRDLWSDVPSLWAPRELEPVVTLRRRRLAAVVASIARVIDRPAFPGDLSVDSRLSVRAVPPRPGRVLDRARAAAVVLGALAERARGVVPLP
ncbi:MAG: peptidoglycan binding domain-containing protein, partial [Solirubrobacteraceae bacterium]